MVAPHPDLQRRFNNTDNIIKANKPQFIPGLYAKYPRDYIDIETHRILDKIKPWIEELPQPSRKTLSLQPAIIDKILVLCVDFNDKPAQLSASVIQDRFFGPGNSLKNYYKEVSYSQYIPQGEVHGWFRAPNNLTYYTVGKYGFEPYPNNAQRLVEDTIDIARTRDLTINWTLFDTNGNNNLDSIIIVHSGAEAAATGNPRDFWAHVWQVRYPKIIQGKTITVYAMTSEFVISPTETNMSEMGVDCHEFGHLINLPDLYDYSGNSNGVGFYSLMGSGSWTNGGKTPTHLDAWSKYYLRYANTTTNPRGFTYIGNAETNPNNIKYTTLDPREFFLIENRQNMLFDTYLPSNGILIWRINENQPLNNNELCFKVGLIQADRLKDLENKINHGDLGDAYPGLTNNRSFGRYANPNSVLCNGTTKDMLISNISNSSNIMSFDSSLPLPTGSLKFTVYPPAADIYFNTTYKGTTDISTGILIINNIHVGTIDYTIKKTGYYDRMDSIIVDEDIIKTVSVILTEMPGSLNITSNPIGANIYIAPEGQIPVDTGYTTPAIIPDLSSGNYTYKLTLEGYHHKTGSFTIIADRETIVDVGNLIFVSPATGVLDIMSNPSGATIYIDNNITEYTTPATVPDLFPGDHIYKLILAGYQDKSGLFEITPGEMTTVDAGNLTPITLPVVQAGFTPVQAFLITGLTVGMIYSSMGKPKILEEKT